MGWDDIEERTIDTKDSVEIARIRDFLAGSAGEIIENIQRSECSRH